MTVIEILQKLISVNTTNPPGNEAELSAWIAGCLEPYGFLAEQPECGENRRSIAAVLSMGTGPKMVLNGHLDVVPAGEGWKTEPFAPVMDNGCIYGRGSADMKGGVAAMMAAGMAIAENHQGMRGTLCLNFVADEETTNLGTISCKKKWEDADLVVIGEPTEMQLAIAHKGTARFKITVHGKKCHSGIPWDGVNAIEKTGKVIQMIQEFDKDLKQVTHPLLSRPSISVTMIKGGEKDNIIPDSCAVCVDYRMIPGDTGDSVEKRLRGYLEDIRADDPSFLFDIQRYINLEPGEIPSNHRFVKMAADVFEREMKRAAVVRDFPATCEQVLFTREGIPAIIVGPGSIKQAHTVDEFVEISQVEAASRYYEALVRNMLGENGNER